MPLFPQPAPGAAAHIVGLMCQSIELSNSGRLPEALACLDAGLRIDPDFVPCRMARAKALAALARFDEALADLNHVATLAQLPDLPAGFAALLETALAHVDARLAADGADAQAYYLRGNVYWQARDPGAALADYERAAQLDAGDGAIHMARGNALYKLDRFAQAVAAYDGILALDSDNALAWYNRGNALQKHGDLHAAIASYRRARAILPDFAEAWLEEAHCLLAQGELAAGWRLYEWRWRTPQLRGAQLASSRPRWRGDAASEGQTVLLWAEQGFGDTIQFARFIARVADRVGSAGRVIARVPDSLRGLLSTLDARVAVMGDDEPLPPHDVHCPLMSLPLALGAGAGADVTPAAPAYLRADAGLAALWQARLGPTPGPRRRLRIGLCWAGRMVGAAGAAGAYNPGRDIPLATLAPLAALDIQFVGLQKTYSQADDALLARLPNVLPIRHGLDDFAATAALLDCLDLVITVDTAMAHLAGALGKPTWLLLRHAGEWRWQRDREDTPWYPSLQLYRQQEEGGWDAVVRRVAAALAGHTGAAGAG